jgi:hypothetical protein
LLARTNETASLEELKNRPVFFRKSPKKHPLFSAQKLVHNNAGNAKKIGILCTAGVPLWISAGKLCTICEERCGLI